MLDKIKKLQTQKLLTAHNLGLVVLGLILLSVSWSGAKAIQRNHNLEQKVSQLQQQNNIASLQNANQKLRNDFFESDEFLELQARRQFGLAAPGEKLLIVPKEVAQKYIKPVKDIVVATETKTDNRPVWLRNISAWLNFYFHRETAE